MDIKVITKDNFNAEVTSSDKPVLLDFWAVWCGPCQMLAPTIEELARDYEGKVKIGKVNVDEQPELSQQYGIMSIPTLIYFKDGQVADQTMGVQPRESIEALMK